MLLLVASFLLGCSAEHIVSARNSKPSLPTTSNTVSVDPRIINGGPADPDRFPYIATLEFANGQATICGGALVAPNVVLSAAHCAGFASHVRIGRHNKNDPQDDFDDFQVVDELIHPLYEPDTLDYDLMLIRLSGQSSAPPVRVNDDPNLLVVDQDLTVIGFGDQDPGSANVESSILLEATVQYVPNDVCENIKSPGGLVFGRQFPDVLMCAFGEAGEDTCQGDSGGPLIATGASFPDDVLVGVTSWGVSCSDPVFPGIYARCSAEYQWIAENVCLWSVGAVPNFNCGSTPAPVNAPVNTPPVAPPPTSPSPTPVPVAVPTVVESPISLMVDLQLGLWSYEYGFFLEQIDGFEVIPVARVFPGAFTFEPDVMRSFPLEENALYSFLFFDDVGDGLEAGASVDLSLRDQTGATEFIDSFGPEQFLTGINVLFYATTGDPVDPFYQQTVASSTSAMTLQISFDAYPEEIGVEIRDSNGNVVFYRPPRFFYPDVLRTYTERFSIPNDAESYTFTIVDVYGDGFGSSGTTGYGLFAGDPSTGRLVASGDFVSGAAESHAFLGCELDSSCGGSIPTTSPLPQAQTEGSMPSVTPVEPPSSPSPTEDAGTEAPVVVTATPAPIAVPTVSNNTPSPSSEVPLPGGVDSVDRDQVNSLNSGTSHFSTICAFSAVTLCLLLL